LYDIHGSVIMGGAYFSPLCRRKVAIEYGAVVVIARLYSHSEAV